MNKIELYELAEMHTKEIKDLRADKPYKNLLSRSDRRREIEKSRERLMDCWCLAAKQNQTMVGE